MRAAHAWSSHDIYQCWHTVAETRECLQAAKTAAEATETAAREAEEAANKSDALEATSKAAVAAWRASQVQTKRANTSTFA